MHIAHNHNNITVNAAPNDIELPAGQMIQYVYIYIYLYMYYFIVLLFRSACILCIYLFVRTIIGGRCKNNSCSRYTLRGGNATTAARLKTKYFIFIKCPVETWTKSMNLFVRCVCVCLLASILHRRH